MSTSKIDNPNILIIMTDQQRWDSLGCYGFQGVDTPNLDRLAREGALFTNCYVNNPICTPSRASMWTGKRISSHGVCQLHDILPEQEVLLPERLREGGYQTALFGKLHVSGRIYEEAQRHPHDGFDVYEWCMEASISLDSPLNGYASWLKNKNYDFFQELKNKGRKLLHIPREYHFTHWAAERTREFIRHERVKEKPFFCLMSVFDPHNPYEDYPKEYGERVHMDRLPPVISMKEESGEPSGASIAAIQRERQHSYFGNAENFSTDDVEKIRKGYYASLSLLDDEVGEVLKALDEEDITDSTLVIFISDHGDMIGDHDLYVKGIPLYDPVVKVPFIMHWSERIPKGKTIDALVQPSDLFATCLSAAEIEPPKGERDTEDLLPLAAGKIDFVRDIAVCEYRNTGINHTGTYWDPPMHATMVRYERYKFVLYHPIEGISDETQMQLFDMQEDPKELRNLAYDDRYVVIREKIFVLLNNWFLEYELRLRKKGGSAVPSPGQRLVNIFKK
jgi:arylsulfatase